MFTNPLLKENEELKQRLAETLVRIIDLERALEAAKPGATQMLPPLRDDVPEPLIAGAVAIAGSFVGRRRPDDAESFGTNDAKVTRDNQPLHGLKMAGVV